MVRELYQRLREYFNNLPEPTEEEKQFIRELNAGDFPITSVHRDDLEGKGFDVKRISDDDMQNLAKRWRTITMNSCSGSAWKLSPEKSWVSRK